MYERLLDKGHEPSESEIRAYLGEESFARLTELEKRLAEQYQLTRALRFPFGENYGWGYKYGHRTLHLCYAFFEKGAFTVTVQVGDAQVPALEAQLDAMPPKAQALWAKRYPCGERGGWVHYRVLEEDDLLPVMRFVNAKKPPKKTK